MDGDGDLDVVAASNVGPLNWHENLNFTPPAGDYDHSGTVDNTDFLLWKGTYGSTFDLRADGNANGKIDAADYVIWRKNLGVTVYSPPALPGDYNRDDVVNSADYVAWRKTLGNSVTPYSGADGNGNGVVDQADLAVWKANYGNTLPPQSLGQLNQQATAVATGGGTGAGVATVSLDVNPASAAEKTLQPRNGPTVKELATPPASLMPSAVDRQPALSPRRIPVLGRLARTLIMAALPAEAASAAARHDVVLGAWLSESALDDEVRPRRHARRSASGTRPAAMSDSPMAAVNAVFELIGDESFVETIRRWR
jgi:hypothetical protein